MKRKLVFNGLAAILSLIIIAVFIEAYVRIIADDGMQFDLEMWKYARDVKQLSADPLLAHEHAPNRAAILMGVDFQTNSKGLRDREFSYDRQPGTLRILMLGNSLTVGWRACRSSRHFLSALKNYLPVMVSMPRLLIQGSATTIRFKRLNIFWSKELNIILISWS